MVHSSNLLTTLSQYFYGIDILRKYVNDSRKKLHIFWLRCQTVTKDYCYAQSNTEKESLKELSLTLTLNISLITNILFHRKSVTTVLHCTNHFVYFKFEVVY